MKKITIMACQLRAGDVLLGSKGGETRVKSVEIEAGRVRINETVVVEFSTKVVVKQ